MEFHLHGRRQDEQQQCQQAEKDVFEIAVEQLQDQRQHDEAAQKQIDGKAALMFTDLPFQRLIR